MSTPITLQTMYKIDPRNLLAMKKQVIHHLLHPLEKKNLSTRQIPLTLKLMQCKNSFQHCFSYTHSCGIVTSSQSIILPYHDLTSVPTYLLYADPLPRPPTLIKKLLAISNIQSLNALTKPKHQQPFFFWKLHIFF